MDSQCAGMYPRQVVLSYTKSQPQAQTQTQRRVDQSKNLLNGVQRDKNPPNISIGAFLCCVISKQEGALGDLNNWET